MFDRGAILKRLIDRLEEYILDNYILSEKVVFLVNDFKIIVREYELIRMLALKNYLSHKQDSLRYLFLIQFQEMMVMVNRVYHE